MNDQSWRDRLAGSRLQVDREFSERVRGSELSSQEWSLVMTAVEFEIEGEGADAELVADTSKVPSIVPEFENLQGGMYDGGGSSSGGIVDSLKSALGGGGPDQAKLEAAETLAAEYADRLQERLEENGRWAGIREAAHEED